MVGTQKLAQQDSGNRRAVGAFLIRLAACFLCSVWPVLVIIAVIALTAVILYRIWKHKRDMGKW